MAEEAISTVVGDSGNSMDGKGLKPSAAALEEEEERRGW